MSSADLVTWLERTRDNTLPLFDLGADALERRYGPGKWTVRVILQHLADAECVYGYRVKRAHARSDVCAFASRHRLVSSPPGRRSRDLDPHRCLPYSCRSARTGVAPVARRAGAAIANRTTTPRASGAPQNAKGSANGIGSVAAVSRSMMSVNPTAAATPTPSPISTGGAFERSIAQ